jgi:hypothetical protein
LRKGIGERENDLNQTEANVAKAASAGQPKALNRRQMRGNGERVEREWRESRKGMEREQKTKKGMWSKKTEPEVENIREWRERI